MRWPQGFLLLAALTVAACSSNTAIRAGAGGSGGRTIGTDGAMALGGAGGQGEDAAMSVPTDATLASEDGTQDTQQSGAGGIVGLGGAIGSGGATSSGGFRGSGGIIGSGGNRADARVDLVHDSADTSMVGDTADASTGAEANPAQCPTAFGLGEGRACPLTQGTCDYPEGRCACLSCAPDGGIGESSSYWHCRAWTDVPAGCPARAPALGSSCSFDGGLVCDYDQCCGGPALGPSMQCSGGAWQQDLLLMGGCACVIRRCP